MNDIQMTAASAKFFIRQLQQMGLKSEDILEGTGLPKDWAIQDGLFIYASQYTRIVENALKITANPALGLELGSLYYLFEFGVWGYAILSSTTLGEALRVAIKYWEMIGGLVNMSVKKRNGQVLFEVIPAFRFPTLQLMMFAVEELLSQTLGNCHLLTGQTIDVGELHLVYPEPAHAYRYNELIHAPIYFGDKKNLIIVPESILSMPTVTGHPEMRNACEQHCREMLVKLKKADTFIDDIRTLIISSMNRPPHAHEISRMLKISLRTFYRKLRHRNITYQDILDEVRAEIAKDYLSKTNLSVDQISDLVGFSETTTFRRSFKKWLGVSPSGYRKRKVDT